MFSLSFLFGLRGLLSALSIKLSLLLHFFQALLVLLPLLLLVFAEDAWGLWRGRLLFLLLLLLFGIGIEEVLQALSWRLLTLLFIFIRIISDVWVIDVWHSLLALLCLRHYFDFIVFIAAHSIQPLQFRVVIVTVIFFVVLWLLLLLFFDDSLDDRFCDWIVIFLLTAARRHLAICSSHGRLGLFRSHSLFALLLVAVLFTSFAHLLTHPITLLDLFDFPDFTLKEGCLFNQLLRNSAIAAVITTTTTSLALPVIDFDSGAYVTLTSIAGGLLFTPAPFIFLSHFSS